MAYRSAPLTSLLFAAMALAACGGGGDATPAAASASPSPSALTAPANDGSGRVMAGKLLAGGAGQPTLLPLQIDAGQETVTCRDGLIAGLSLDTIIVPDGASCEVVDTSLKGSIKIGARASLAALNVAVTGDLQAEGASWVGVRGASTFGGSIQIKQGQAASVDAAQVNGDVQIDAMADAVSVQASRVGGSLQAIGNRGGVTLVNNSMKGNLQCKDNMPTPTGSGNQAASKEDQCAAL